MRGARFALAALLAATPFGARADAPELLLGMSTVLTGSASDLGEGMRLGVEAGLERANRSGGVHGRRLRLITLDDGYEPTRTVPNMRELIEKDQVLAVIGNVGTPTAIAAVPIAQAAHTLFFAGYSGSDVLRNSPPERYVINFRASYSEEGTAMIDALIDKGGLAPEDIAFFTQSDGYGDSGFRGVMAALRRHGLKDEASVVRVKYKRNTLAVEDAVANLLLAPHTPRAVVMVGTYGPCAKFIRLCRDSGFNPLFMNVSFVGAAPLAAALGKTDARVVITQVVPHPFDVGVPLVAEFQSDLKLRDPGAAPGFTSLEGYIAARVLVRALENIRGEPTRESIVTGLEALGRFDVGLGQELEITASEHQACHRVWPTIMQGGRFVPLDWSGLKALAESEAAP